MNNSNQLNMFRAMISPILRSTRLCVTACGIMHRYNAGRVPGSGGSASATRLPAGNIVGALYHKL